MSDDQTTPVTTDTPVEGAEAVTTPEVTVNETPATPDAEVPAEGETEPAA